MVEKWIVEYRAVPWGRWRLVAPLNPSTSKPETLQFDTEEDANQFADDLSSKTGFRVRVCKVTTKH
jgi:hypothetical protein